MTICKHSYTDDRFKKHRSMGKRCPYPEFYEKARSTASIAPKSKPTFELPMDERGCCIFHSQAIAWKRKNDFKGKFLELVQLLDAEGEGRDFDFAEFVFVGGDLTKTSGSEHHVLHIADTSFRNQAYFTGASFLDSFALERVNFQNGAAFDYATFDCDLRIENVQFNGVDFSRAKFAQLASFTNVEFLNFALFGNAQFTGSPKGGYTVKFEGSRFEGITDFSGATFSLGDEASVGFLNVQFEDFTDFRGTQFNCQVVFRDVSFASTTEFVDTSFDRVRSSARYRGTAVEFNRIEVTTNAVLTFMSTDPQNKMFNHDVQISFKEDPAGTVRFENVNFSRIITGSKDRLIQLAKSGSVEIGSGCIKYRFQTDLRTIFVTQGYSPLIIDMCQTFTNYFTVSNGLNLGFEIVERDKTKVSFFYFTDEDISGEVFLERLAETEKSLWNLLAINSDDLLQSVESPAGTGLSARTESAVINAVDGVSALLGTFFRVGARITLGAWKEADTKALLGAIRFSDEGADDRALNLHQLLVEKYTGRTLFGINRQQNELLTPMVLKGRNTLTSRKVRILFLGANSSSSPLELDREVKKIQTSLKLAKERDNLELKQEWAVTVETLMQALLDESPTIVHFSGHGDESGIILEDDMGKPKVVSADALSSLFKLFKDTVQCVVLNSCYSEHQARVIRRHIPYVIGMRSSILDPAAVAFSTGFYKALGAGKDIPFAFNMGQTSIEMEGVSGEDVLVLL